ncbi:MAG TPA: hypothetical protein VIC54_13840 [Terriglobales bacterium]|jgi:hypothetical protein
MPGLPLAEKLALLLGPDAALRRLMAAALTDAGATLVDDPERAHYLVACGASVPLSPSPCWESVLLIAAADTSPEAAALPALARYWALRLAPRVRVNALLLGPNAENAAGNATGIAATAIYLLAAAHFTTGATLRLDDRML